MSFSNKTHGMNIKNRIPSWDDFLYESEGYAFAKYPMQIVMRGNIGLTSKEEDFTKSLMKKLYEKYVRMVLIIGEKSYNTKPEVPDNRKNKIDYSYPILNFASTSHVIIDNKEAKMFNKKEHYPISADKKFFYQEFEGADFIPKSVYSINDIEELELPIIAKPKDGHSAQGIEKFESYADAKKSKLAFDTWSECKDIDREFRAFVINDKIVHVSERITNIDHDMSVGKKNPDEKIDLIYVDQDMGAFKYMDQIEKIRKELKGKVKLDFYNIDLILDTDGKMWVPEINGAPGIGPSIFYSIYPEYVKLAYGKSVPAEDLDEIEKYAIEHRNRMKKEYAKEFKTSLNPL